MNEAWWSNGGYAISYNDTTVLYNARRAELKKKKGMMDVLIWLWGSFHSVYMYQTTMLYVLNILEFLSVTFH